MRPFHLRRLEDVSGVSGLGVVAEGVELTSGWCVVSWLTAVQSMELFPSLADLVRIHGHDGRTRVEYLHGLKSCEEIS